MRYFLLNNRLQKAQAGQTGPFHGGSQTNSKRKILSGQGHFRYFTWLGHAKKVILQP
jgi:hypothetical protein